MINDAKVKSILGKQRYTDLYGTCLKLFNTEVANQYDKVDYNELTYSTSGDSNEEPITIESTIHASFYYRNKLVYITCTLKCRYGHYTFSRPTVVYFDDGVPYE